MRPLNSMVRDIDNLSNYMLGISSGSSSYEHSFTSTGLSAGQYYVMYSQVVGLIISVTKLQHLTSHSIYMM